MEKECIHPLFVYESESLSKTNCISCIICGKQYDGLTDEELCFLYENKQLIAKKTNEINGYYSLDIIDYLDELKNIYLSLLKTDNNLEFINNMFFEQYINQDHSRTKKLS